MAIATGRTPNLFELHGDCLAVTYSTGSFQGKALLTYQDAHRSLQFTGDDIRSVEAEIGELVSITLCTTPDLGSTTFTVLLPAVSLATTDSAPVDTAGVTTIHRTSIAPGLLHGQTEMYQFCRLTGTARAVEF